jgi:hypothetical protein
MIQSFNTQLQVAIRALREVVAPALNPSEKQSIEQLHLSLATLEFMRTRLPYARRYYRMELENHLDLASKVAMIISTSLAEKNQQLELTIRLGKTELDRPEAENEDYLIVARQIREMLSAIIAAATDQPFAQQLNALIVRSSQQLLLQERVWCLPFGFELRPEELPSIDELLAGKQGATQS